MTNLSISFEHNRPEVLIWDPVRGRNVTMEQYNNPDVDIGSVTIAETIWPNLGSEIEPDKTSEE